MAKSYKVSVIAGNKILADMVQQVKDVTWQKITESMPAIQGGTTSATAVVLPAGPSGQNRWFDASWGYWKYNNTVLKNPLGTDGIPEGNDGMLYWDGTALTWKISKMQLLPVDQDALKKQSVKVVIGKNKLDKSKLTDGYMNNMGVIGANPAEGATSGSFYVHGDFIETENGKSYHGEGASNATGTNSTPSGNGYYFRYVTFFDKNKVLIPSTTVAAFTANFTVPSDLGEIKYFVPSFLKSNKDTFQIEEGNVKTDYEPYSKKAVAIEDTPIGNAEGTFAEKSTVYNKSESDSKYATASFITVESKNIANLEDAVGGRIVQSGVNTFINENSVFVDWKVLAFNLEIGKTHLAIQGWDTARTDIFFGKGIKPDNNNLKQSTTSSLIVKSGSLANLGLPAKSSGKTILVIPTEATWFALNIKNNTESPLVYEKLMIEYSEVYSEYEPYFGATFTDKVSEKTLVTDSLLRGGKIIKTSDLLLSGDISSSGKMKLTVKTDSNTDPTLIDFLYNGNAVQHKLRPYRIPSLTSSQAFEFYQTLFNGVTVHNTNDDGTPYRFNDYTLGANHGYAKSVITMVNHGKQNVDVGSIWTTGSKEFVLTNVIDSNTIEVSSRTDNTTIGSVSSLNHVSGATNTAIINVGSVTHNGHFFPVIQKLVRRLYLDGIEIENIESGEYNADKTITFSERYEIMNKNSIMEWLITQVGTQEKILHFQGTSDVSVSNTFVFDSKMGCTEYQDFLSLRDGLKFQDIMFLQVYFGGVDGPVQYYIPKSLPIPYRGVNYDFSKKVNMSLFAFDSSSDNLDFTPAFTESTGILTDRVIKLQNSVGFAVGFVPIRSNSPENRRSNADRKALQIRGTKKIYMSAIDSASRTTLNKGDYFSSIGYRKFFELSSARTDYYTIDTTEGSFVYADWHSATIDVLKLDGNLLGKKMSVIEKTNTVNILTPNPTDSMVVEVFDKGYIILKFE